MLIQAGARLTGCEVLLAAENSHMEPLSAALTAGGDPNSRLDNGTSALQIALKELHKRPRTTSSRGAAVAALLLEKGARLLGGEVISAIRLGDWDLVNLLLSKGGSLMDTDGTGMTALEAGILSRNPNSLYRLLEAHPDDYDSGALCAAVVTGMHSVIERLLALRTAHAHTNILETTAVGLAAKMGDLSLLRKFLACLPLSNVALLPVKAGRDGTLIPIISKCFWRDNFCVKGSPLALAAMGRAAEAVGELLRSGCEPDRLTWTISADQNDLAMTEILVNSNKRLTDSPTYTTQPIHNPLIGPIQYHNKELVLSLLEAGADVNEHSPVLVNSRSPLQLAIELGNLDTVDCLLKAGADVNAPPAFVGGGTALQLAVIKGHLGLAKQLLDLGARVNAPQAPRFGRTALEGAAEHGRLDMLELLLQHGAPTTGSERCQYIRSVKLATREGYHAAAELLRSFRDWSEQDESLMKHESLLDETAWRGDNSGDPTGEVALLKNVVD
ncbi:hypothetical protein ACJZ2D_017081 [Fusarium nematophilum]